MPLTDANCRMDKYLYLIRCFLSVSLRSLARAGWKDEELLDDLMNTMADTPLNARDAKIPNGLRYHMLDIYLDELEKVDEEHEADIPAEKLLDPLMVLQKECPTRTLRLRAKEVLEDERVLSWLGLSDAQSSGVTESAEKPSARREQNDDDDDGDWNGIED